MASCWRAIRSGNPVERLIAEHLGIEPAEVLLTNGTDEAIHLICETYLEPGDEALIGVPTFAMYEIYAAATGAKILPVLGGADFHFPVEELLAQINQRTRLIAVANPNNPTGTQAAGDDLIRLAKAAPERRIAGG